jgi:hypothetical protein
MDCPRVQSTIRPKVGAAVAVTASVKATKKAATWAACPDALFIVVSFDHNVAGSVRGNGGLEAETRKSSYHSSSAERCRRSMARRIRSGQGTPRNVRFSDPLRSSG